MSTRGSQIETFLSQARRLRDSGRAAEAYGYYRNVLQLDTSHPEASEFLAKFARVKSSSTPAPRPSPQDPLPKPSPTHAPGKQIGLDRISQMVSWEAGEDELPLEYEGEDAFQETHAHPFFREIPLLQTATFAEDGSWSLQESRLGNPQEPFHEIEREQNTRPLMSLTQNNLHPKKPLSASSPEELPPSKMDAHEPTLHELPRIPRLASPLASPPPSGNSKEQQDLLQEEDLFEALESLTSPEAKEEATAPANARARWRRFEQDGLLLKQMSRHFSIGQPHPKTEVRGRKFHNRRESATAERADESSRWRQTLPGLVGSVRSCAALGGSWSQGLFRKDWVLKPLPGEQRGQFFGSAGLAAQLSRALFVREGERSWGMLSRQLGTLESVLSGGGTPSQKIREEMITTHPSFLEEELAPGPGLEDEDLGGLFSGWVGVEEVLGGDTDDKKIAPVWVAKTVGVSTFLADEQEGVETASSNSLQSGAQDKADSLIAGGAQAETFEGIYGRLEALIELVLVSSEPSSDSAREMLEELMDACAAVSEEQEDEENVQNAESERGARALADLLKLSIAAHLRADKEQALLLLEGCLRLCAARPRILRSVERLKQRIESF